jgi:PilS N terminal
MCSQIPSQPCKAQVQKGSALLYALLALVLGGVGLAVSVKKDKGAEPPPAAQATAAEVNAIIGKTKQNFGQYDYRGLTTPVAMGSQVIPQGANNRFGGPISLNASPLGGSATLIYSGVPSNVCVSIVNGTQGVARAVAVNSSMAKPDGGTLDVVALNAGCTNGGATVRIVWIIGKT